MAFTFPLLSLLSLPPLPPLLPLHGGKQIRIVVFVAVNLSLLLLLLVLYQQLAQLKVKVFRARRTYESCLDPVTLHWVFDWRRRERRKGRDPD